MDTNRRSFFCALVAPLIAITKTQAALPQMEPLEESVKRFREQIKLIAQSLQWTGDSAPFKTAQEYVADWHKDCGELTKELALEGKKFYTGRHQWSPDIRAKREAKGRPCITVNRLPEICYHVLGASPKMSQEEEDQFFAIMALRNREHQKMYNYIYSTYCELIAAGPQRIGRAA